MLAGRYEGKRLNSLDDVVCERQHSFTQLVTSLTSTPMRPTRPRYRTRLTLAPDLRIKPDFDPTTPQAREAWQAVTR